jgi:acyl carrier protein
LSEKEVLARLTEIVREVLDNEDVALSMDTTPSDVQGWDSLAHVSIVVAVERAFRVRFTAQQVEGMKTVGDLVRLAAGAVAG